MDAAGGNAGGWANTPRASARKLMYRRGCQQPAAQVDTSGMNDRGSRPSPISRAARKIVTVEDLLAKRAQCREMGLRLVHCHGCFDIVHPGHIRHLKQARAQGDLLLVSLTSDEAFSKRGGRPLIAEHLRAENLAEMDCVDLVLIDRHPTAADLLRAVSPDVYVKGQEYEANADPRFALERRIVEQGGGRVVFTAGDVVFSSTALIGAMERAASPFHARMSLLAADGRCETGVLTRLVDQFRQKRVVVIGESIIDTYVHCDQPEVASESPVMTLRPVGETSYDGGAAVVARHLRQLGASVELVTGLGERQDAENLRQRLVAEGIGIEAVSIGGAQAEKRRFLIGVQKVMKLNCLRPIVLDAHQQDELIGHAVERCKSGADAVIIADFGNGLLTGQLVRRLCRALRPLTEVLVGDVSGKRGNLAMFEGADLLTPGEHEARDALRCYDAGLTALAWKLLSATASKAAIMKLGPEGCMSVRPVATTDSKTTDDNGEFLSRLRSEHIPPMGGPALDALGCGDAMLATATLALTAGGDELQGAVLGSMAAAVHAGRIGNPPISSSDLMLAINSFQPPRLSMVGSTGIEPLQVKRAG